MGNPIYNKRHPLEDAEREIMARMVRVSGVYPTAKKLACSPHVVEELSSGGGCTVAVRDRIAHALRKMREAS